MAGKTNLSDYRFSIFINNDQAKRSLVEMEKVMRGYEDELSRLVRENKKDSQEYRDKKKVYDDHLEQMKKVRQEAGLQALSVKELKSLRAQLNNEMARAIPGSEHRNKLQKEFDAVNARLEQLNVTSKESGFSFGRLADGFNRYFAVVTAGIAAISGFAFSIKNLITTQGELDDSLANIRKTTQMTADEVKQLNRDLGKIDTRTSRQDLREMAVVAGQLGIAKDDVFAFVSAVDKLNVALGDEIKGGAEEVSKTMGTLRNVLTDMKSSNIADDMLRIGNAINELGAAGFATAPVIADFSNRIGGIGIPLGLTSDEVLGLSATLQELNVSTERGGTAVIKILQKMTTNTDTFAKIAGMSVKDFTKLVNTDLFAAFTKVLEGSKQGGQSATLLAGIIKELEVTGAGASEVFAKLGNNTDMLREKVGLAGASLQNTDSIMNEFNIKNATLGATLNKLSKEFYSLITLPSITEFFKNQVYHVVELVKWFKILPQFIEKYTVTLVLLTGATLTWVAAKTRSLQIGLLNTLMLKEGILLKAKDAIMLEYLILKEQILTVWKGKGTAATKLATIAQMAWNTALRANPFGIVITAITALVAAIKAYDKYNAAAIRNEEIKESTLKRMAAVNKTLEESYATLTNQIRNMNRLSIQEKADLQDKIEKNIRLAETELALMKIRQQKIREDNTKPTVWQGAINAVISGPSPTGVQNAIVMNAVDAANNGKKAADELNESISKLEENLNNLKNAHQQVAEITNAEAIGDGILGKSKDNLEEKLQKYQTALRNTIADSEDFVRIQNKIKEVNKELSAFNDGSITSQAGYEDAGKKAQQLGNELLEVRRKIQELSIDLIKNGQEKELKLNELNYQRNIESIKGYSYEEEQLRELYLKEKKNKEQEILKKYSIESISKAVKAEEEKWKEILEADLKGSEDWLTHSIQLLEKQKELELRAIGLTPEEIKAIKDKYASLIAAVKGDASLVGPVMPDGFDKPAEGSIIQRSGADKPGLDFSERIHALKTQRDIELELTQGNVDAQKVIWQEFYDAQAQMIQAQVDHYAGIAQQILSALSGVNQAMTDYENAQVKKDEDANEKKKANLKKRLDSGEITQKEYNDQVAKLDEQLDAKKKELSIKQAKRQKVLSLAQAIINVAQAVTSALSAGPIIGIILAALVGLLGAVQIGYIASTPIPEAAKGRYHAFRKARQAFLGRYYRAKQAAMGRYDVTGEDDGQLYRDVPFIDKPKSGIYAKPTLFAETGREIILSAKHTENLLRFRPDLVQQIMRVPQRAAGNYQAVRESGDDTDRDFTVSFDKETIEAISAFTKMIKKPLRAELSYDTMVKTMDDVQKIESDSSR